MYYLRTRDGLEVDLVVEWGEKLHLFEIKGTMTLFPKHASSLVKVKNDLQSAVKTSAVISMSQENVPVTKGIYYYNWKHILLE